MAERVSETHDQAPRASAVSVAGLVGLVLPEETIAGVIANRALLDQHLARVRAALEGVDTA